MRTLKTSYNTENHLTMKKAKGIDEFLERKHNAIGFNGSSYVEKLVNPFTGIVSGNYWSQTGMPWVTSEGRKAVLTEWFWQLADTRATP